MYAPASFRRPRLACGGNSSHSLLASKCKCHGLLCHRRPRAQAQTTCRFGPRADQGRVILEFGCELRFAIGMSGPEKLISRLPYNGEGVRMFRGRQFACRCQGEADTRMSV